MKTTEKEQDLPVRPQFTARVRPDIKSITDRLVKGCNFTNEELLEVALAALVGTKDNVIDAKRLMAQMKAKELKLSFERANHQPVSVERLAA